MLISESTPEGALLLFSEIARCSMSSLQQNKFSAYSNMVFFRHKALMKINPVFPLLGFFYMLLIRYTNWILDTWIGNSGDLFFVRKYIFLGNFYCWNRFSATCAEIGFWWLLDGLLLKFCHQFKKKMVVSVHLLWEPSSSLVDAANEDLSLGLLRHLAEIPWLMKGPDCSTWQRSLRNFLEEGKQPRHHRPCPPTSNCASGMPYHISLLPSIIARNNHLRGNAALY